jgi:serine/threonine-protein kinase HipA
MRKADIYMHNVFTGTLIEVDETYHFQYLESYKGPPISLTMPVQKDAYEFDRFTPLFDGLLPEGVQLEGLLSASNLDRTNYMGQLMIVGQDLVGAVTVQEAKDE